jgi:putative membrane protein
MYALLHVTATVHWTAFSIHWSTVVGLLLLGALYWWRARRTAAEIPGTAGESPLPRPSRRSAALFATALVLMFLALNGWVHDLSDDYLFSAHMVQHLVLALAVAPLMVMGTPGAMLRPALANRALFTAAHAVTRPIPAFAIFNTVVAVWHLPPLYNTAMAYHDVHIVQHLMFLAASVIMWWPVLSPIPDLPRLSYPGQMLYLFLMTIPMSIISVYITYSGALLYPAYANAPRIWGISPMEDQLIGGLIMWIPGGLYFFAVISAVFFRWQRAERVEDGAWAAT